MTTLEARVDKTIKEGAEAAEASQDEFAAAQKKARDEAAAAAKQKQDAFAASQKKVVGTVDHDCPTVTSPASPRVRAVACLPTARPAS